MARDSSAALARDIQALFEDGTAVGLTDRQLLDRFAGHRDPTAEVAFEALVRRHGPMVLRVCRNVLADPNDAEDAFQATFLVLVRRCGTLKGFDSLGGWLYGVACRVAARARVEAARRRSVEGRAALRVVEAVEPDDPDREDFGPIVQEEVWRLPESYRAVVVLCHWEGLTHEQAAARLGCPLGTVRSRIARARDILRRRLTRRGLAPMAVGLDRATGSIPKLPPPTPEMVRATVNAAARLAAGQPMNPAISALVASLVHAILWRTTMIKLGGIAAGLLLVGMAGYGAGLAVPGSGDPTAATSRPNTDDRKPTADPVGPAASIQAKSGPDPAVTPSEKHKVLSRQPVSIMSKVEGQTTIVAIVPDGTVVKKGDVICELNSSSHKDQLVNQRIAVKNAEAAYQVSRLTREVAEIAVTEYREGDYVEQLQEAQGNIKLAEAELVLAHDEIDQLKKSSAHPLRIKRAELTFDRARFALEKAQSRLRTLTEYTRPKKFKELESAVKKVEADELARRSAWELEVARERNLEQQIRNTTLTAPIDGRVRYKAGPSGPIAEGVAVQERQVLFTIEPQDQPSPSADKDKSAAIHR